MRPGRGGPRQLGTLACAGPLLSLAPASPPGRLPAGPRGRPSRCWLALWSRTGHMMSRSWRGRGAGRPDLVPGCWLAVCVTVALAVVAAAGHPGGAGRYRCANRAPAAGLRRGHAGHRGRARHLRRRIAAVDRGPGAGSGRDRPQRDRRRNEQAAQAGTGQPHAGGTETGQRHLGGGGGAARCCGRSPDGSARWDLRWLAEAVHMPEAERQTQPHHTLGRRIPNSGTDRIMIGIESAPRIAAALRADIIWPTLRSVTLSRRHRGRGPVQSRVQSARLARQPGQA
jgi:hypothetical protein